MGRRALRTGDMLSSRYPTFSSAVMYGTADDVGGTKTGEFRFGILVTQCVVVTHWEEKEERVLLVLDSPTGRLGWCAAYTVRRPH